MKPAPGPEQIASLVFAEHLNKLLYKGETDSEGVLTTPQLVALTFIADNPACTIKQLAAGTRINHSAASQAAHRLVALRMVDIEPGQDRRQARLNASAAGTAVLDSARRSRLAALDAIFRKMSPENRQLFVDGVTAFLKVALNSESKVDDACGRCWVEHFGDCIVNLMHREITGRDTKRVPA